MTDRKSSGGPPNRGKGEKGDKNKPPQPSSIKLVQSVVAEPRTLGPIAQERLVRLWQSRGGGFYAAGYVVCFLVLEVKTIVGEVASSTGVVDFLSSQLLEFFLRMGFESLLNGVLAFLWPAFLIDNLGITWALPLVVAGFFVFNYWVREWLRAMLGLPSLVAEE